MKKLLALILAAALLCCVCGCGKKKKSEDLTVNVGFLKGPTGMCGAQILENADEYGYNCTVAAAPTEITAALVSGELDIAAVPTNAAATLYSKTKGDVQIAALTTGSVLYILTGSGIELDSLAELRGRTIYATGQGANPEFVLKYLLEENGLDPEKDVEIVFGDGDEIAMKMALGEIEVCMLPVPNTTSILIKNALGSGVGINFDLGEEWEKVCGNGSSLTMGCIAVRREFAEKHPEAVAEFLSRCESSVNFVLSDPNSAAQLIAKHGITGSSEIALYAIPDSGIEWLTGDEIKPALAGYYDVLFNADPASVGGALPDDGFYYANVEYEKNK